MKKKMLTINSVAISNIKRNKKRYITMIIGIVLAMVFSSSILLFVASSYETSVLHNKQAYGQQDCVMSSQQNDMNFFEDLRTKGFIESYGVCHSIGYGYTDYEKNGAIVAWLDDKAKELQYQEIIAGVYPTKENEIAVEKDALLKLGYDETIGQEITLNFKVKNGMDYGNTVTKSYKLVGILKDKRLNFKMNEGNFANSYYPAIYVADGTHTEVGGKEFLVGYVKLMDNSHDFFLKMHNYCSQNYDRYDLFGTRKDNQLSSILNEITTNGKVFIFLAVVLILASCIGIINAFNSNINEQKKKIGMYRAVGATKRQIFKIFGREAFILSIISIPLSVGISYLLVYVLIKLIDSQALITKNPLVLIISGLVGLFVSLLSSAFALISATKITPMQAIRNIDRTRKLNLKKIKSKEKYNPSSLLAKRRITFSKIGTIVTSLILIITICFSSLGFSYFSYSEESSNESNYDYSIHANNFDGLPLTDIDKDYILSNRYVQNVFSVKESDIYVEIGEYNDYLLSLGNCESAFTFNDKLQRPFKHTMQNHKEAFYTQFNEEYLNFKSQFNFNSEFIQTCIRSADDSIINKLANFVVEGKIDIDKLSSGEEVILIAPKKSALEVKPLPTSGTSISTHTDEDYPISDKYIAVSGERPYHVGDTFEIKSVYDKKGKFVEFLNFSTMAYEEDITNHSEYTEGTTKYSYEVENTDTNNNKVNMSDYVVKEKEVKVGAIISPDELDEVKEIPLMRDSMCLLTTHSGMNHFNEKTSYRDFTIKCNTQINDEINKQMMDYLNQYEVMYDAHLNSQYEFNTWMKQSNYFMNCVVFAISMLGFAVSISIINNIINSNIKADKRTIGTLRAVGASQRDLVMIYVRQLISMLGWGIIIGFILFILGYFAVLIFAKFYGHSFYLIFNPYPTICFVIVTIVICIINLFVNIKKEMKNSIVENIREL